VCLDAIASAPLPSPFRVQAGELVASASGCATECNAHQIFNCQRTEKLSRFDAQLSIYYSDCLFRMVDGELRSALVSIAFTSISRE
jgi:hypothetical protein